MGQEEYIPFLAECGGSRCNATYLMCVCGGVEIGRIEVQSHPGQKVLETPSQLTKVGCGDTHLSSQLWGKPK
jgi:hypothetical protein